MNKIKVILHGVKSTKNRSDKEEANKTRNKQLVRKLRKERSWVLQRSEIRRNGKIVVISQGSLARSIDLPRVDRKRSI